jgi:hypothetical protein
MASKSAMPEMRHASPNPVRKSRCANLSAFNHAAKLINQLAERLDEHKHND